MKNRSVHENLDTSFVNLSALIKYLRRKQFVGNIRVELGNYEADILLTADDKMRVREHDRAAGRVSEGEEALQRLLIRAREPDGVISVYQTIEETESPLAEEKSAEAEAQQPVVVIPAKLPHRNGSSKTAKIESPDLTNNSLDPNSPKLPFELNNNFEARAKQTIFSAQDWQMLLNLTAELLNLIDKSLAEANLEFAPAFEKARLEISGDYPFLNPASNIFDYKNGKVIARQQINPKLFAASLNEALRRILDKLGKNPKFLNIYFITTQKIIELIEKRKPLYDKFSITPQLERTVGA